MTEIEAKIMVVEKLREVLEIPPAESIINMTLVFSADSPIRVTCDYFPRVREAMPQPVVNVVINDTTIVDETGTENNPVIKDVDSLA